MPHQGSSGQGLTHRSTAATKLNSLKNSCENSLNRTRGSLTRNHNAWVRSTAKLEHFVDSIIPHPTMISGLNLRKVRNLQSAKRKVQTYRGVWAANKKYSVEDQVKLDKKEFLDKMENMPIDEMGQ
jgi:hypothetical protein